MDCIFCKIISGEIPSEKVYENDTVFAFKDIRPVAPEHILVVPKKHIANIEEISLEDGKVLSDLFMAVKEIASARKLNDKGYRLILNNGKAAGQEVFHLHLHVIGGKDSLGPMISR